MRTSESSLRGHPLSTPNLRRAFRDSPVSLLLSTGLGVGFLPFAPGTAGSALGLLLAWLLARAISPACEPSMAAAVGLLMSGLAVGLLGVPLSTRAARALGSKDPGCIVIDEIAGQLLASAVVPLFPSRSLAFQVGLWAVSFLSFRLFDIWKPGPIRRLQRLPEGWGIVADDLLAGALACGFTAALGWAVSWRG